MYLKKLDTYTPIHIFIVKCERAFSQYMLLQNKLVCLVVILLLHYLPTFSELGMY